MLTNANLPSPEAFTLLSQETLSFSGASRPLVFEVYGDRGDDAGRSLMRESYVRFVPKNDVHGESTVYEEATFHSISNASAHRRCGGAYDVEIVCTTCIVDRRDGILTPPFFVHLRLSSLSYPFRSRTDGFDRCGVLVRLRSAEDLRPRCLRFHLQQMKV